ncbi:hypothetical protein [Microbulbifer epialgicus]|uniref:HsdR n=1 Tax=Microbulbifer epialgicus TaxID=393907 RepID=A0ABV4P066_9GAMM
MNNEEIFSRLIENALDFLSTAALEVENNPKYSVIHFYSAVELFLKARLLADHWTLVISKKQDPDWDKFIVGDFQSVTLGEAAIKLDKAVKSPLTKEELDAFKSVGRHRNKIVHFYHKDHGDEAGNTTFRQSVVKQQLKAWHYLHSLLMNRWGSTFTDWEEAISQVDTQLRDLHSFLQVIYDELKAEIEAKIAAGERFDKCPSCGFQAQSKSNDLHELFQSECLVCGLKETEINIKCESCDHIVTFASEGYSSCSNCKKHYEPKQLAEILLDDNAAYSAAKEEGDFGWGVANCSDCDSHHTVVNTTNQEWICACCLTDFTDCSLEACEWCNEKNTGDMEMSYFSGCNMCEGSGGWYAGKDE